ncbi:MAG: hypothetical protein ACFBQW_06390 [Sphingomonadaceae bacterium]
MRSLLPLVALAILAACDPGSGSDEAAGPEAALLAEPEDPRIECAIGENAPLERVCTFEQTRREGALLLTVRQPDGGFRRLEVREEEILAADGAEPARVTRIAEDEIEVRIGSTRYRLPALAPARAEAGE